MEQQNQISRGALGGDLRGLNSSCFFPAVQSMVLSVWGKHSRKKKGPEMPLRVGRVAVKNTTLHPSRDRPMPAEKKPNGISTVVLSPDMIHHFKVPPPASHIYFCFAPLCRINPPPPPPPSLRSRHSNGEKVTCRIRGQC